MSEHTSRRAVLAGISAASLVGLAGCSTVLGSKTHLSSESEQSDRDATVIFTADNTVKYSVRLVDQSLDDGPRQYYPVNVMTGDQGELQLSALRLEFDRQTPKSLYLGNLSRGLSEAVEFYHEERTAVLELPDPESVYASGSLQFPLVYLPSDEPPHSLSARVVVTLVDEGVRDHEYTGRGRVEKQFA